MNTPRNVSAFANLWLMLFLLAIASLAQAEEPPRQWRPIELTFMSDREIPHPFDFDATDFRVEFTGPDKQPMLMPGFWDGGRTWKVRFVPTQPGKWKYRTICQPPENKGLHGQTGEFTALPAKGKTDLAKHGGFLGVDKDHPVLTYTDGTPLLWIGDTWWNFPELEMTLEIAGTMADRRLAQGFTVYQAHGSRPMILKGCNAFQAVLPPNDRALAYWKACDPYYQLMFEKGLIGAVGVGAHEQWDAIPVEDLKRWFRYHLARFGSYGITYLFVQEFDIAQGNKVERIEKLREVARYFYDLDPYKRALSVHPASNKADHHVMWDEPWHKFALVQSGHFVPTFPQRYWKLRDEAPQKPIVESEHNYEGFAKGEVKLDDTVIRRSFYSAMLAESAGFTYGAQGLYANIVSRDRPLSTKNWGPVLTWDEGLELPGGRQIGHAVKLFKSLNWPSWRAWRHATGPKNEMVGGDDGKTSLVYYFADANVAKFPPIPDQWIRGPGKATWFDPRRGTRGKSLAFHRAPEGWVLPKPPDHQDWLLIIDHGKRARQ